MAEFDGLGWSKPGAMRRFFVGHREDLGQVAGAAGHTVLESLLDPDGQAGSLKQGNRMCDLLLCIVGDPYSPRSPVSPAVLVWNGSIAVKLATSVYDERDFSPERMSVLADALAEAGLDDEDLLRHLRGPGPHCRDCHALDALLGKG